MSPTNKKTLLRPSILDRLIDHEPQISVENEKSKHQQSKELRDSVRRDLENLLNSRHRILSAPSNYTEIQSSLINYGLPDLATINIRNEESKEKLTRDLEKLLKDFEPRFKSVQVTFIDNPEDVDRTLRFRINATLYADPAPELIIFDSVLEPVSRSVNVKETQYG